ncbi:DUF3450 domain-containing protein [Alteromonas sediminis]|uniref:DUF3450 domain-containing protein n=1 Tax=Alteromonas sediminis TaxID=2259342 RepID=A0A3N5Z602_9ALTE|nr:DUF3450 domain-containing protein [Alteromonas sediminis]RPJ65854.1 DUF3450 domain-containing protein [Alteromonas sediminis]
MRLAIWITLLVGLISSANIQAQDKTQTLVKKGLERLEDNQAAQKAVDKQQEQIESLEEAYQDELYLIDGLNMYNAMLQRQLDDQASQISQLDTSINNATQIERQIMPLLVRMIDALDTFVAVDVPFLLNEREERVAGLRELLSKAEYTTSEKTRRVFEAYQIENEYGYTIESYKGRVTLADEQFAVDFLRIGRIGLMYRDLAGERVGFWNNQTKQWQPLTENQYKRHILKGLKIAKEEISPELITLPLFATIEERP